ncbi:MAG TPA: DUF29 domain-containing protein [Bryobacteraceae bacterium]|nr:DUF29 domain-containing protein [Bryobacteraceae bacterium]
MPRPHGKDHLATRSYSTDYAGWAEDTAQAIQEGRWGEIDRTALADEVESLSKRVYWQFMIRLEVLLAHLLKDRYQPEKTGRSWQLTIQEQRRAIEKLLAENPSLGGRLSESAFDAYEMSRFAAARETGLELASFPEGNPFTSKEIWGEEASS